MGFSLQPAYFAFLYNQRPPVWARHHPSQSGASLANINQENAPKELPTGQSYIGNSSSEAPSSQDTLVSVKRMNNHQHSVEISPWASKPLSNHSKRTWLLPHLDSFSDMKLLKFMSKDFSHGQGMFHWILRTCKTISNYIYRFETSIPRDCSVSFCPNWPSRLVGPNLKDCVHTGKLRWKVSSVVMAKQDRVSMEAFTSALILRSNLTCPRQVSGFQTCIMVIIL